MIKVSINDGDFIDIENWMFPGGEVGIRLQPAWPTYEDTLIRVQAWLTSSDEIMKLLMVKDALDRVFFKSTTLLLLPYLPYARQDRVTVVGESLSAEVMASLINSMNFTSVVLIDVHSDLPKYMVKRSLHAAQEEIVARAVTFNTPVDCVVGPDAGSMKKATMVAQVLNTDEVYVADKVREPSTGKITGMKFSGDVRGKNVLVADDICDGGRTFLELIPFLREAGAATVSLYITHGIFSKGVEELTKVYDHVYTTNSFHHDRIGLVDGVTYFDILGGV